MRKFYCDVAATAAAAVLGLGALQGVALAAGSGGGGAGGLGGAGQGGLGLDLLNTDVLGTQNAVNGVLPAGM